MKIRNRLALYYTLISSVTQLIIMVALYLAISRFFKQDFYARLTDRINIAAQLYLKADELSTDSLSEIHDKMIARLPEEVIRIYNSENMAEFIKEHGQYWGLDVINLVRKKGRVAFQEGNMNTVGGYYHDNQGDFVILASAYDHSGHTRLAGILEIMAITFIVINASLFFIGRFLASRTLSPIDRLIQQIRQIRATKLDTRVNEGSRTDEIGELAISFNQLLAHLQNTFEMQQTFVANASHELRTPVTSMLGEIEVTLLKDRSGKEYIELLESLKHDVLRLSETTQNLMNLAQIDMDYTLASREPIHIDELIWDLESYWAQQKHKGNQLQVHIANLPEDSRDLVLMANENLLKIALNNIIGNAFKYSDNLPVILQLQVKKEFIIIDIVDHGIGVPEEEKEHLLRAFYRSANSRKFQGSGIGLFITNKIVELYHGKIDIILNTDKGSTFRISFLKDPY